MKDDQGNALEYQTISGEFGDLPSFVREWITSHEFYPEISGLLKANGDKLVHKNYVLLQHRANETIPRVVGATATRFHSRFDQRLLQIPLWERNQAKFDEVALLRRHQTANTARLDPGRTVKSFASLRTADVKAHKSLSFTGLEQVSAEEVLLLDGLGFTPFIRDPKSQFMLRGGKSAISDELSRLVEIAGKVATGTEIISRLISIFRK